MKEDGPGFFELFSDIRNAIMHGDDVSAIERSRAIELASVVNTLGSVAWTALFNAFLRKPEDRERVKKVTFLQTNLYVRKILSLTAHLQVYSRDQNNPKLEEMASRLSRLCIIRSRQGLDLKIGPTVWIELRFGQWENRGSILISQ